MYVSEREAGRMSAGFVRHMQRGNSMIKECKPAPPVLRQTLKRSEVLAELRRRGWVIDNDVFTWRK